MDDFRWQPTKIFVFVAVIQRFCRLVAKRCNHIVEPSENILSLTRIPCNHEIKIVVLLINVLRSGALSSVTWNAWLGLLVFSVQIEIAIAIGIGPVVLLFFSYLVSSSA